MGDPAGIGPETIAKAWAAPSFHRGRRFVVVGRPEILREAVDLTGSSIEVTEIESCEAARSSPQRMPCLTVGSAEAAQVRPAEVDPRGGQAAYDALAKATELALAERIDGLVTTPLHKTALAEAGFEDPGHTELLAKMCGVEDFAMMLYLPPGEQVQGSVGLGVVHVTLHVALRDVFEQLSGQRILACGRLARRVMVQLGAKQPRIAVAALNPHAGENGLFGEEERRLIAPAVDAFREEGAIVEGPLPCDTLMVRAAAGEFDGVVAMYHDQGHIALKLLGMHSAVNITLGLPIVRTSVAHGTAFDLAWQGVAEYSGLLAATDVAARLAASRRAAKPSQTAVG